MNVGEVLKKINEIDSLICAWGTKVLSEENIDEAIDLLTEYKDELLKKKVV